jgi:hypothetical protein
VKVDAKIFAFVYLIMFLYLIFTMDGKASSLRQGLVTNTKGVVNIVEHMLQLINKIYLMLIVAMESKTNHCQITTPLCDTSK